jgi:ectoine hydroxylase-related dioxygenase (phytanoyl-CoA dioxygenase family)
MDREQEKQMTAVAGQRLDEDALAAFDQDGFVVRRGMFTAAEVDLLQRVTQADPKMSSGHVMPDADGGESRIWLDMAEKADIANAIARNARVLLPMRQLLGGEVYVWHYKMMLKQPLVGGAWEWHQDYGYWYNDNCLFPQLASCMIAVNRATPENGCLQVLRGSHRLGRIAHGQVGGQTGADTDRVAAAAERLEHVHVSLDPGDALFFHCNLLHRSDQNRSEHPRWSFICCYNAMANIPFGGRGHGKPVAAEPWHDERITTYGERQLGA